MNIKTITYAKVDALFYEAMRINLKGRCEARREGQALIKVSHTHLNRVLIQHPCMNPSNYYQHNRGEGIAQYHKSVTGKYPRMNGSEQQQSKAIGIITTLPRDYIKKNIQLTDDEYEYLISEKFNSNTELGKRIDEKLSVEEWTDEEIHNITNFFQINMECILAECGVRTDDVLYSVIHFDETFPHMHLVFLPTKIQKYEKNIYSNYKTKDKPPQLLHKAGDERITFSTEFMKKGFRRDAETGEIKESFYNTFHHNVIRRMKNKGVEASGLLNGETKGKGFDPGMMIREEREESVKNAARSRYLKQQNSVLEEQNRVLAVHIENLKTDMDYYETQCVEAEVRLSNLNHAIEKLVNVIMILEEKLTTIAQLLITTVFDKFIPKWKTAQSEAEREKVENAVKNEIDNHIYKIVKAPCEFLQNIKNDITITQESLTDQQKGFVKRGVLNRAATYGDDFVELFKCEDVLALCYERYSNVELDTKIVDEMSEVESIEYFKGINRRNRAFEYALNKLKDGTRLSNETMQLWKRCEWQLDECAEMNDLEY